MHPLMDRGLLQIEGMSVFVYYQHVIDGLLPASSFTSREPGRAFIRAFARRLSVLLASFLSGIPALDTLCVCIPLQATRMSIQSASLRWLLWLVRRVAILTVETVARARVARSDEFSVSSALIERWRDGTDPRDLSWRKQMKLELAISNQRLRDMSPFYQLACFFEQVLGLNEEDSDDGLEAYQPCEPYRYDWEPDKTVDDEGRIEAKEIDLMPAQGYDDHHDFFIIPLLANVFCTGCVRRPVQWMEEGVAEDLFKQFLRMGWGASNGDGTVSRASLNEFLQLTTSNNLPFPPVIRSVMAMAYLPDPIAISCVLTGPETVLRLSLHTLARQRRMLPDLLRDWSSLWSSRPGDSSVITFLAIWYIVLGFALNLYNDGTVLDGRESVEAHWIIAALSQTGHHPYLFASVHAVAIRLLQSRARLQQLTRYPVYDDHRMARRWRPVLPLLEPNALDHLCIYLHNYPSASVEGRPGGTASLLTNAQCYAEYLPPLLMASHALVL